MLNSILEKLNPENLESVTGMDATFLYGETETSPMHVGSVAIIEGSLEFETFKATIASRLHMVPKLRKRLMSIPFSIDYPYWVDDPHFNIDMHIDHVALPKPGSWKQLRSMASRIFSEPLPHSRPLWSFTFVEGLDNLSQVQPGSIAIISKVHHVAIDGVAGAGLLAILFDMSPTPSKIKEPPPYNPQPLPNILSLIANSSASFAKNPLKFPKLMKGALEATVKAGFLTRVQHLDLPTAPFTAPQTPLNGIISAKRKWNTSILSLERVKNLRKIMGTTLNDVILTICAGALRRYLLEKNKLPLKPLVAMVPISTRSETDEQQDGNKLSAMLVQLATHIADPIERLETIYENTIKGKTYQGAMGAKSLSNLAEAVPFGVANQAARLYSRYNLSKMHNPVFNVVITNVPGPQMPIYLGGHKLHSIMGMAPIINGMGLIITVLSYNGNITISPTSDAASMPDLNKFSDYILDAANELETAVIEHQKTNRQANKSTSTTKITVASDRFFTNLRKLGKEKNLASGLPDCHMQFLIKGEKSSDWNLKISQGILTVKKSKIATSEISFVVKDEHFKLISEGKIDVDMAIVQGRLLITGNDAHIVSFKAILKNYTEHQ